MIHEFLMAFAPVTTSEYDAVVESLGASCNDATFSLQGRVMTIQFAREAATLRDATNSAFNDLCDSQVFLDIGAAMVGMTTPLYPPPRYVTPDEAASLFRRHYLGQHSSLYDDMADEFAELIAPDTYTREQVEAHLDRYATDPEGAATTPIARDANA